MRLVQLLPEEPGGVTQKPSSAKLIQLNTKRPHAAAATDAKVAIVFLNVSMA